MKLWSTIIYLTRKLLTQKSERILPESYNQQLEKERKMVIASDSLGNWRTHYKYIMSYILLWRIISLFQGLHRCTPSQLQQHDAIAIYVAIFSNLHISIFWSNEEDYMSVLQSKHQPVVAILWRLIWISFWSKEEDYMGVFGLRVKIFVKENLACIKY